MKKLPKIKTNQYGCSFFLVYNQIFSPHQPEEKFKKDLSFFEMSSLQKLQQVKGEKSFLFPFLVPQHSSQVSSSHTESQYERQMRKVI
jgi:hypothetical protein